MPYLRPEGVLLFKARARRPKDEADLAAVLPELGPAARAWPAHLRCCIPAIPGSGPFPADGPPVGPGGHARRRRFWAPAAGG
ncbi:MAG TPA: hypothetical protein VFM55_01750 [Micromonosporaceae bacterium]|nr:hypothetical protein [Micromonosporaceae bacterium]